MYFICEKFTSIFLCTTAAQTPANDALCKEWWSWLVTATLITNDIRMVLMVLLVGCSWRDWMEIWSLMVHLWRMMMHAKTQTQRVMSIVVRLWWYMIMTVWICVVGACLLSLRVFFIPERQMRGRRGRN